MSKKQSCRSLFWRSPLRRVAAMYVLTTVVGVAGAAATKFRGGWSQRHHGQEHGSGRGEATGGGKAGKGRGRGAGAGGRGGDGGGSEDEPRISRVAVRIPAIPALCRRLVHRGLSAAGPRVGTPAWRTFRCFRRSFWSGEKRGGRSPSVSRRPPVYSPSEPAGKVDAASSLETYCNLFRRPRAVSAIPDLLPDEDQWPGAGSANNRRILYVGCDAEPDPHVPGGPDPPELWSTMPSLFEITYAVMSTDNV